MKTNRVLGLILATAVGLSTSVVSAEGITGFQEFQFGMSLSEVQAIASLTPTERSGPGNWYEASHMVTILGDDYNQLLVFNDEGRLFEVHVTREFGSNRSSCRIEFEKVYRAVLARYSEPDRPPERADLGIAELNAADFTQRDGSKVRPSSTYLSNKCILSVAYIAVPVGVGF